MGSRFLLSTVMSACALSFGATQVTADEVKQYGSSWSDDSTSEMSASEVYEGTIKTIRQEPCPGGRLFIMVVLDTRDGEKTVLVGPVTFINESKVKLKEGDKITVKGYRDGTYGEEVITAQEINKDGAVLKLRDEQRKALWPSNRDSTKNKNGS